MIIIVFLAWSFFRSWSRSFFSILEIDEPLDRRCPLLINKQLRYRRVIKARSLVGPIKAAISLAQEV